ESKVSTFLTKYGEPVLKQAPIGTVMDENFTGVLYYPGFETSFENGRMRWISVVYIPAGDTAIARRVENSPIIPDSTLGGITLGMTEDQVRQLLGETHYKYQKLNADFWYYPQYAIKVQFGIPPVEGQLVNKFVDSTYIGKVTGITAAPRGFFEGILSAEEYKGTTPNGIGIDTAAFVVHQKNGDPIEPLQANPRIGAVRAEYKGIVFYMDPQTQAVNHIFVTNTDLKLPFEEVPR
ncbi:MAG TPA: outer membrane protein assembly factor BamE, partial [Candidatus Kapabacteria bacterium]|nr:outer membrane protein assembly factor BamE [Candidatus Kapabacteria bacterium]